MLLCYALIKFFIDFLSFFSEIDFVKQSNSKYIITIKRMCRAISILLSAKIESFESIRLTTEVEIMAENKGLINQSIILNLVFVTHKSFVILNIAFVSSVK